MNNQVEKEAVRHYWNQASCGTEFINEEKYSRSYFEAIESFRYSIEPEIFSFAQFTRYHGKRILEVGVGAGSDFIQWIRAGAVCSGIDLTEEAIKNASTRIALYGLPPADLRRADAESLPFANDTFDLAYSWGVIHHSPDTEKCLKELIRVTKKGGTLKIMVYNRHSLFALYQYLRSGILKGKLFTSFKKILATDQESPGTKAYTEKEIRKLAADLPIEIVSIKRPVSSHDLLYYRKNRIVLMAAHILAIATGWNLRGWFMMIELKKI